MTDALRDAELLARAVVEDTDAAMERYQRVRDEVSLDFFLTTDRIASFDWDLATVKQMHLEMSKQMNLGVAALSAFGDPGWMARAPLRRVASLG